MNLKSKTIWLLAATLLMLSCSKEGETVVVPDNIAPPYGKIPTILVENYINKLYIDLLGREPLNQEMVTNVAALRAGELKTEVRADLILTLQSSTNFVAGDTSYKHAYFQRFYDLTKVRMVEGVGDDEINRDRGILANGVYIDSLVGNVVRYQLGLAKLKRYDNLKASRADYREGRIDVGEVYARMLNNAFYDQINMNSINFIRASFNDLFFRFHTQDEFDHAFNIIEFSQPDIILGQSASDKLEYIDVMVHSREFYEGMVQWAYRSLLAREPDAAENKAAMDVFFTSKDFQKVQRDILVTEEYAGF